MERVYLSEWIKNRNDYVVCKMKKDLSLNIDTGVRVYKKDSKQIFPANMASNKFVNENIKIIKDDFLKMYRPYTGQNLDCKTILIEKFGGIGDLIYIQPTLFYLKTLYPTCKIIFSCSEKYNSLIKDINCYDEFIPYPIPFNKFIRADYHLLYYGIVEKTKEALEENLYTLCSKYAGLNEINIENLQPKLPVKEDKVNYCKKILDDFKVTKFIAVQKSASTHNRTPPNSMWKSIFDYILSKGISLVFTDSPHKSQYINDYIRTYGSRNMFSTCGMTPTLDSAVALQSLSELNLCCNTSMIPISHAINKKVLSIHGPFLGKLRTNGKETHQWVDGKVECGPCFMNGEELCKNNLQCFLNLNTDEVISKIDYLLNL